jgi:transglutaminase-like putative cysteine protease
MKRYSGLFLFVLLLSSRLSGQKISVGKEPSWILRNEMDYNTTAFPQGAEDGYMNLCVEKQVDLGSQCVYHRKVKKIITETGIQNGSEVSVSYDPSYERVIFHAIQLIRQGRTIDKLDLTKIRTVKQETELTRSVYNGTVTSVLFLEDVRKGDIIDYSYSLIGFNPVFNNKYNGFIETQLSAPVGHLFYRIVCPAGRTLYIKNEGTDCKPVITNQGTDKIYQWEFNKVSAIKLQDELPSWYDPAPTVMVGEYSSWNELCQWALPLFSSHRPLSRLLTEKIAEIRVDAGGDPKKKILQSLRFVQDEIRYLGIEMGVNSHKPNGPDKVLAQRYGDCKDKSFLLCTMLQALGVDAAPVLINTTYQNTISGWLPSPLDFDHATVRVRLDGRVYWLDPTIALQRGDLKDISFPDYKCGLVLTDTTTGLTLIPLQDSGQVIAQERFVLEDNYGPAKLEVTTRYTGSFADDIRSQLNSESRSDIQQRYQNFYNNYYSETKPSDSLVIEDDERTGMITTHEAYTINKLWDIKKGEGKAYFYGLLISSVLKKPQEQERQMPVAQTYPARYTEELEIRTPEDWNFDTSPSEIKSPAFSFTSFISTTDRILKIKFEYRSLRDYIPARDAAIFLADYDKLKDGLSYALTKRIAIEDGSVRTAPGDGVNSNPVKVVICILLVLGIAYAVKRR